MWRLLDVAQSERLCRILGRRPDTLDRMRHGSRHYCRYARSHRPQSFGRLRGDNIVHANKDGQHLAFYAEAEVLHGIDRSDCRSPCRNRGSNRGLIECGGQDRHSRQHLGCRRHRRSGTASCRHDCPKPLR
jgi:hypothetical protein